MLSPGYLEYLKSLGLGDTQEIDADHCPAIAVAKVRRFLPSWNIATIFIAAFAQPDIRRLEYLRLNTLYSIYYPGRLGLQQPSSR